MSILIKGMEMPQNCTKCRFAVDGWCCAYGRPNIEALANYERTNFCPLIPVPPHGRLIDADALCDGLVSNHPVVIYAITAPTIIEAEGEDGQTT